MKPSIATTPALFDKHDSGSENRETVGGHCIVSNPAPFASRLGLVPQTSQAKLYTINLSNSKEPSGEQHQELDLWTVGDDELEETTAAGEVSSELGQQ